MASGELISVDEAIRIIDEVAVAPRVERVRLEIAQGRRLAADLTSDRDYPPFDKSLMDGFAVRTADVQASGASLRHVGEIAAGNRSSRALGPGECVAIMTGAPIPRGADAVVPVENTSRQGDAVLISMTATPGHFIARKGEDASAGALVLRRAMKLEAAQLAVAASVGASEVDVFAPPRAVLLSTGDEIVPIDQRPGETQIRNSNSIMLAALLKRLGCAETADLGLVRDDRESVRASIESAFAAGDVLFITGGMSMGNYDYVPEVLVELGVRMRITKLRIKPGKPFVFGTLGEKFVFGLPGNPVSSFVCALRLCSRLLVRLAGGAPEDRWISAALSEPLGANGPREFYQPAIWNGPTARPLKWRGSADIYTLATANALIRRPENAPPLASGQIVELLAIPD